MEEEMIKMCNIMPVELAIKRELEYRKKMEVLMNQHQIDLNPLISSQGPPTQAQKEDAELAPILQFSSSSQMFKEKPAFSCKACQLTFGSVFHLTCHTESQHHKVNISEMKMRKEAIINPICCESCGTCCSSLGQIEDHLKGSKHTSFVSNSVKRSKKTKY